jgi:F0F1-type ATP synthase assembly protein I
VFDLSAKRELNKGFGSALEVAVELAVTPAIFALAGWWIDDRLGTFPAFLLVLFLFTFSYVAWKQYRIYQARMAEEERQLLGDRGPTGGTR